jgi:uncharacterized protein with HEPN domain
MRSDADWPGDILSAVAKIKERISDSFAAFQGDAVKDRHPEVPWPQIIALRNILVHEYFGLNMHQVWTMTQKDLPTLEEQVQRIRGETVIEPGSGPGA